MNEIVPIKSNRQRALEALERMPSPTGVDRPASLMIAATVSSAVKEALTSVAGYSSHGRSLDVEMTVAHRSADGSQTTANVRVRY